jgi:2-polyprenyl-3-methyl-5-hydroxy-6-metoxy-1,4-benzoquinol methylase
VSGQDFHVAVAPARCPCCGADDADAVASGVDYYAHRSPTQRFTMVQCRRCQTWYLNPRPEITELVKIYGQSYYSFSFRQRANGLIRRMRQFRDRLSLRKLMVNHIQGSLQDLRVLDVGCGDGTMLHTFKDLGVPANQLYGADVDAQAIGSLEAAGINGLVSRAEDVSYPEGSFDLIVMQQVIEHVAGPKEVLSNLLSLLRPGGVLLVETPNVSAWDRPLFRGLWGGFHFPRHWTLWNKRTIRETLLDSGFCIEELTTFVAPIHWIWSLNHVCRRSGILGPLAGLFTMRNPILLGLFVFVDLIPGWFGVAGNMRIVASRPIVSGGSGAA